MPEAKLPEREPRVLLVEDSNVFGTVLQRKIEGTLCIAADWVTSYKDCEDLLATTEARYVVALLDINLPDAPDGQVIDLVLSRKIPVIIFTGRLSDKLRDMVWSRRIVDYILKQSTHSIDYALKTIQRIISNKNLKCLVVDDSKLYRKSIVNLLEAHGYKALEAQNGREALEALALHPDVKLILADYNMPDMDGVELTRQIRRTSRIDEQAIIGISNADNKTTSVLFLKNGANDYIKKPFQIEEFYCRISLNIDTIQQFDTIKKMAYTDYLTQVYNRRYLFEAGSAAAIRAMENGGLLTVTMIDIDHFKNINDTYGHDAGDVVIVHLAATLRAVFPEGHIIGRIGGEEFCIVSPGHDTTAIVARCDRLRAALADAVVQAADQDIRYTVSVGVHGAPLGPFETMLKAADCRLYTAKTTGRDKVVS